MWTVFILMLVVGKEHYILLITPKDRSHFFVVRPVYRLALVKTCVCSEWVDILWRVGVVVVGVVWLHLLERQI